jgi:hypothetical protein
MNANIFSYYKLWILLSGVLCSGKGLPDGMMQVPNTNARSTIWKAYEMVYEKPESGQVGLGALVGSVCTLCQVDPNKDSASVKICPPQGNTTNQRDHIREHHDSFYVKHFTGEILNHDFPPKDLPGCAGRTCSV